MKLLLDFAFDEVREFLLKKLIAIAVKAGYIVPFEKRSAK